MKILIVDDSVMQRQMLIRHLRKKGFEAESVATGEECLEFISDHMEFDYVVTDYRMPGMSGTELITELKNIGYLGKVIICSADVQPESQELFQKSGAHGYLTKPIRLKDLEILFSSLSS